MLVLKYYEVILEDGSRHTLIGRSVEDILFDIADDYDVEPVSIKESGDSQCEVCGDYYYPEELYENSACRFCHPTD